MIESAAPFLVASLVLFFKRKDSRGYGLAFKIVGIVTLITLMLLVAMTIMYLQAD